MSKNNNIELRSEEVKEILGSPPGWIIRRSISIILLIIIVLLIGSYFYKYPDIVSGRVTILSENPPIPIVAKSTGRLELLLVEDGEHIKVGQVVGMIENPADFTDMQQLNIVLDSFNHSYRNPIKLSQISLPELMNLGQCQSYYATLVSQWNEYNNFVYLDSYGQQQQSLIKQIAAYRKYEVQLKDQCFIQKKELDLSQKQLSRDSSLYSRQVMPEVQYEQSQSTFLKQQYSYKNTLANLSNTQIQIGQLEQKELELQIQKEEQVRSLLSSLKEKYDNLSSQYSSWKQSFVLSAGIEGTITFTELWSEKQPVQAGKVVFTVVPIINQAIIGKLIIPLTGSGKVEPRQTVNIKLDNYPYMEFGLIEGTIESISKVPVSNAEMGYYIAKVSLNEGLLTNYNKELFFAQEMQGTAEIITKDRRLLERLVQPVVAILKKNLQ